MQPKPGDERTLTGFYCIGECGRALRLEIDDGLVFKQINFLCASCAKETKYTIPKGTATKFDGLPPGQTMLEAAEKDE